jgi:TetR/AcrR family transcriptional regulator, transcriptional repressor for nem operon
MARRDGADTRQRLIEAAIDLLRRRSYLAAGVDDLCRVAAARKGSFYHFFETKADLAVAAVDFQWTVTRATVFQPIAESGAPGLDRLRRLVEHTDAQQRHAHAEAPALIGCPFGSLGQEMAHQDARIRLAVQTVFDHHCRYLQSWLDEAVRARQVPPGDTVARARQVFALFEGALLLAKVAGEPALFAQICTALPAVAGRSTTARSAIGTAPELL